MDHVLQKKINGGDYTFTPCPADPGQRIYRKLHGYVAPVLGTLAEMVLPEAVKQKTIGDLDMDDLLTQGDKSGAFVRKMVEHLGSLIADDAFSALIAECLKYVSYNGKELEAEHWAPAKRLKDYDQIVVWCVWQNFGRVFFDGVGNLQGLAASLEKMYPTPQTSMPPSPGSTPEASPPPNA